LRFINPGLAVSTAAELENALVAALPRAVEDCGEGEEREREDSRRGREDREEEGRKDDGAEERGATRVRGGARRRRERAIRDMLEMRIGGDDWSRIGVRSSSFGEEERDEPAGRTCLFGQVELASIPQPPPSPRSPPIYVA
jgi:hypothetical protein